MTEHNISTKYLGDMAFDAEIEKHHVRMDAGIANGGKDTGSSPKRLMLAALAGCTGVDVVSILDKMKVTYSDLQIDVKATLTEDHPKIYDHVTLLYQVRIAPEDQVKMEKAVKLSKEKYCGVSKMFSSFAQVDTVIHYL